MTLKEILGLTDIDIAKMNVADIKKLIRDEQRIIRRRKKSFEREDLSFNKVFGDITRGWTPFADGKITSAGKDINKLRSEVYRGLRVINRKTSTYAGYKKVYSEMAKRLGGELSEAGWVRMWKAYERIKSNPETSGYFNALGSTRVQQMIHDEISQNRRMSRQDIVDRVEQKLIEEYEEGIDTDDFWESIPNEFDIGKNPFE